MGYAYKKAAPANQITLASFGLMPAANLLVHSQNADREWNLRGVGANDPAPLQPHDRKDAHWCEGPQNGSCSIGRRSPRRH